jgi:hypothetical protein
MATGKTQLASACGNNGDCCPIVEFVEKTGLVVIHDPDAPLRGSFVATKEEWNRIVATAKVAE